MENFVGCGKSGHKVNIKGQDKSNVLHKASGYYVDAQRKTHFYALLYNGEQESSLDKVIGMLQIFSINLYYLIDPGDTLS